jgi:asparagine synthase (glutamine-hydrolysing)
MPGLTGCVSLSGRILPPGSSAGLAACLKHDALYAVHPFLDSGAAQVSLVDPGLAHSSGGSEQSADGFCVAFYGEFYEPEFQNVTARQSASLILDRFRSQGPDLGASLDGSFVLFAKDSNGAICLWNDHCGSRPLYYTEHQDILYFAPEPKAFALQRWFARELDSMSVAAFLSHGHLLNDQTFYLRARALPPGSRLRVSNGTVLIDRYYEYQPCGEGRDLGRTVYMEELAARLRAAVRKRIRNSNRLVIPISGGFDSRGILACLAEVAPHGLVTVSWGTDEDTPEADAAVGRQVAAYVGAGHHFVRRRSECITEDIEEMVYRIDGMTVDPAMHHHELRIMRFIRQDLGRDYLFRGDEVFGYMAAAHNDWEALARVGIRPFGDFPDLVRLLTPARRERLPSEFAAVIDRVQAGCNHADYNAKKDWYYFHQRLFNYLHRATYYKLTVLDVSNPWLDKELLDFYRRVPVSYRVDKILYRQTLKSMFPQLMEIPISKRHSLEDWPSRIREGERLQKFISHHLLERRGWLDEYIDKARVETVFQAVLRGAQLPSRRVRWAARTKNVLRAAAPGFYKLIKARSKPMRVAEISGDQILFRLLVLKLWGDRFA